MECTCADKKKPAAKKSEPKAASAKDQSEGAAPEGKPAAAGPVETKAEEEIFKKPKFKGNFQILWDKREKRPGLRARFSF